MGKIGDPTAESTKMRPVSAHPQLDAAWQSWIRDNVARGCTRESLLQSMTEAHWHPAAASIALDQFLVNTDSLPPAVPVPEPTLTGAPGQIVVRGRPIKVLLSMTLPRLVVFGGVLSEDECDQLVAEARPRLSPSTVVEDSTGDAAMHAARVSEGMFFSLGETPLIREIEARLAELVNWPVDRAETLQVLHYHPGGKYEPPNDYFPYRREGTAKVTARGGQRVGTIILYLNTPESGGATEFPEVGLEVVAQKGNAVFFSYARPHASTKTLHGGRPVLCGEKWIATKWLRERPF